MSDNTDNIIVDTATRICQDLCEPAVIPHRDISVGMDRGHRHRSVWHRDPGAGEQPAGYQGLGERHRRRESAGVAQDREAVGHRRTGTAEIVGHPGQRQSRLFERIPQRLWPDTLFGVVDRGRLAQILADAGRGIDDDVVGAVVHRATVTSLRSGMRGPARI